MSNANRTSLAAEWISLVSNILLTGIKIIVGLFFGSQALFADGIHSAADVVASIASLGAMKVSSQPADDDPPYGHGKAEVIASGIVGILLGLSAFWILFNGIRSLFEPVKAVGIIPLIAASLSLIWKQILYVYTFRVGKKYRSKGLIATAY